MSAVIHHPVSLYLACLRINFSRNLSALLSIELLHFLLYNTPNRASRRCYHFRSFYARHVGDRLLIDRLIELITTPVECLDVLRALVLIVRIPRKAGLNSACWNDSVSSVQRAFRHTHSDIPSS